MKNLIKNRFKFLKVLIILFIGLGLLLPAFALGEASLTIEKLARNLSDGTPWSDSATADPTEVISFSIKVKAEDSAVHDIVVKDILPDKMTYQSNSLKIDNISSNGDIFFGLDIGDLASNQTKTITFNVQIAGSDQFSLGQTKLINTTLAYATNTSDSDAVTVTVNKTTGAGAATVVSTGFTNNIFLDSFLLPLAIALTMIWLFKSYVIRTDDWWDLKRRKHYEFRSKKLLQFKIAQIKAREFFKKD